MAGPVTAQRPLSCIWGMHHPYGERRRSQSPKDMGPSQNSGLGFDTKRAVRDPGDPSRFARP